jgi:hypothetical protein
LRLDPDPLDETGARGAGKGEIHHHGIGKGKDLPVLVRAVAAQVMHGIVGLVHHLEAKVRIRLSKSDFKQGRIIEIILHEQQRRFYFHFFLRSFCFCNKGIIASNKHHRMP